MTHLRDSVSFYPVTTVYLAGVVVAVAVTAHLIDLSSGILSLTIVAVLVVLLALLHEVQVVHGHTAELRARISDLVDAMEKAGVALPERRPGAERGKE